MNVLELCLSPGLGGLELSAFRSALALSGKHNVLSVISKSGKLAERYAEYPALNTATMKYRRSYFPIGNALRLARIIDKNKIDVMHMHWGNDLALAAFAKIFSRRKPALVYTRQMKITRSKNDIYHRLLYQQMDLMLCITRLLEQEAKNFIRQQAERITTLYYGVAAPEHLLTQDEILQLRSQHQLQPDDFVVGLFGRLEDGKGQHLLIKAIAEARNNGHTIKALIVGHEMVPGYTHTLQKLASDASVVKQIRFCGFVSQPQALMQACDCIALTSYEETFGLVLPEAMRVGVAVIGSNAGGVPEIIDHETTGLLFEPRNSSNLCKQLERLYSKPEFKHKLAVAGKIQGDTMFNENEHFLKLEQHFLNLTAPDSNDISL